MSLRKTAFKAVAHLAPATLTALAAAVALAPLPARAQQATSGGNGGNASMAHSGTNGANGANGVLFAGVRTVAGGTFTAGSGGSGGQGDNGPFPEAKYSGGSGGSGGSAALAQAGSAVTVTGGTFTAGSGGNGGGYDLFGGPGGSGGGGGSALVALNGSTITVSGGTFVVGHNGSGGPFNSGASGLAGYDLFANGGAITVYGTNFSAGPTLTGSGTFTATIGGITQILSYSVSSTAGSAIHLAPVGAGAATTTTPTSSLNPSTVGQSVTLTAAVVSAVSTSVMPTGSVMFEVGSTFLGPVPLTQGKATLTTGALPGGVDTLTAFYSGDKNFAGSSGSVVQTVYAATQTTLTSSLSAPVNGQSVTFTAAVTSNSGTPTGTVQFAIDGANVGGPVTLSGGQATDTGSFLTPGMHTVTVTYAPTGLFLGNTGAMFTQIVNPHISPQYVSPSGSDSNDGSQTSPKQTIQAAVNGTLSGDTVIVEDGTYTGSGNHDIDFGGRSIIVQSASGDPTSTIIDCGGQSSAFHRGFFFHSGETDAVVSGLTIQNGYEETIFSGVSVKTGSGGGAVAVASGSTVTLTNCIMRGNRSVVGGGVYNDGTLTLAACTVSGNAMGGGEYQGGGGLYSLGTVSAVNCVFAGNSADGYGGGVLNGGSAVFTGCTITGNSANGYGGGLFNVPNGPLMLTDDIVYGNAGGEIAYSGGTVKVSRCDVQGGYGSGNINADPLFVSASAGDFHLQPGSPCVGSGVSVSGLTTDKDGDPRPDPPSIGAYELVPVAASVSGVVYLQGVAPGSRGQAITFVPNGSYTVGVIEGALDADNPISSDHGRLQATFGKKGDA